MTSVNFRRLVTAFLVILLSLFQLTTGARANGNPGMTQPVIRLKGQDSTVGLADERVLAHPENAESPVNGRLSQEGKAANLKLDPLKPFVLGDHPTVVAHLTTEFGKPIPNQPIIIYVDSKRKATGLTDSTGLASITLKFKFSSGSYHIKALYVGVPVLGLPAASDEADMVILPFKASIRTIPPMAGIKFRFNHQLYTSDEKGLVNIQIKESGSYSLEVLPIDNELLPPHITMKFSRWNDNVFTASRQIYFPRTHSLEAGFILGYLINENLFDPKGILVDGTRVSSMTLKGLGSSYTFDQVGPIWLPANRLTRRIGEQLESQNIVYYFKNIKIDGGNVINKSQQRFHIEPADVWPIDVLVYSIRFSARDAMFHYPIGSGIELTYPDGHTETFFFDSSDSEIEIPSLARGSYSATVISRLGSAPPTPIHLSRDQDVELLVLSFLDMAVIFGLPLIFALTLFFIGRPKLFYRLCQMAHIRKRTTHTTQALINHQNEQ